jgi:hypothetical protein
MIGIYVSPVRTAVTGSSLREALRENLTRLTGGEPSEHALTTLVAMSALETGHWKSCWNYNLGNVKASGTWPGNYTCLANVREVIGGVEKWYSPTGETAGKNGPTIGQRYSVPPGHPQTRFRAYDGLAEGCTGWCEKLVKGYQAPLEALLAGADTDTFVAGLKSLSYFTASLENYQALIRALYAQYGGEPSGGPPLVR